MLIEITGIQYPVNLISKNIDNGYIKVKNFILNAMNNPKDYYIQIEKQTGTKFIFLFSEIKNSLLTNIVHGWIVLSIFDNDEYIIDFHRDCNSYKSEIDFKNNAVQSVLELSNSSFEVESDTVKALVPEMEIGTVEDTTLVLDQERQNAQNEFLKKMDRKFNK